MEKRNVVVSESEQELISDPVSAEGFVCISLKDSLACESVEEYNALLRSKLRSAD